MTLPDFSSTFFLMAPRMTRHNGTAIRSLRIKCGKKVAELAKEAATTYPHLDNIENERKEASIELLTRIAQALEVPVAALVRDPSYALHPSDRLAS